MGFWRVTNWLQSSVIIAGKEFLPPRYFLQYSYTFSRSNFLFDIPHVSDFIFWGSTITADGDCSHEIKRCLLLGRKVMTNLDSIFKSRDITWPTKVRLVKAMVFPVVWKVVFPWFFMYGCESWTVKKAERWRISRSSRMLLNCGAGENSWESLGLQGDPTSPS